MKTTVDWFRFRTYSDPFSIMEAMRPAFGTAGNLVQLGEPEKGKDGWLHRRRIVLAGDVQLGAVDYGGESQRDWTRWDMPGQGCEWVEHWGLVESLVDVLKSPQLGRVDLCLTTADRSLVDHEKVVAAHAAGRFSSGGRTPKLREILNSDPTDGRTCEIGSREGHKFIRCYEKGWQLFAKAGVPEAFKKTATTMRVDRLGEVNVADLYRCEVEFKAKDKKVLSWAMLSSERDAYFAGANPFFASLLPGVQPLSSYVMPEAASRLALEAQIQNARVAYGGLFRALYELHGDAERVLQMVMAGKPSEKLVKAGVLTLEH